MMKLLGVSLDGRLGNQLFQYAFIYKQAKERRAWFFIDQLRIDFAGVKYFMLPSYKPTLNAILFKFYLYFKDRFMHIKEQEAGTKQPSALTIYKGYYQSEKYIGQYADDIRREFEIKPAYVQQFKKKFGELYAGHKTIGVHVRKTDIVTLGIIQGKPTDASMPVSFYEECFRRIENFDSYKVVFATDDVNFVKEHFASLPNAVIEVNDEITDLQVLINADIVITANSSFSWWGAWLNTKPHKKVFAPKYWMGTHKGSLYPLGIFDGLAWERI